MCRWFGVIGVCGVMASSVAGQTTVDWLGPVDGDWLDGSFWAGGVYPDNDEPGAGDTYVARFAAEGAPYTVWLPRIHDINLEGLILDSPDARLVVPNAGALVAPASTGLASQTSA